MFKNTLLAVLLALGTMSYADEVAPKASVATEQQSSRIADVYELLEVIHAKENYQKTLDAMMGSQSRMLPLSAKRDPELAKKYTKIMTDFINKYMSWDLIKEDMAKLYAKYYTQQELRDLKKFYVTPTGQKVLTTVPKIAAESIKLSQLKMMPHMKELQKDIMSLFKSKSAKK